MKRAAPFFACAFVLLFVLVAWSQGTEDISGTVTSFDASSNVIVLDDGRRVQVIPGAVVLIGGRPAALTALVPGTRVVIRQGQVMSAAPGATTQAQGAQNMVTVQAPQSRVTVQIPRQTVVVEQQAPQITVQQQPPEVVVRPGPSPLVQIAPPPALVIPPAPRTVSVLPPAGTAVPYRPLQSENRYVYAEPLGAQRPAGSTQSALAVAPPPARTAQATVPPAQAPSAIVTPMLIIAEPPQPEYPAAAVRPPIATGPWTFCDDSLFMSRHRLSIDWVFASCQAP